MLGNRFWDDSISQYSPQQILDDHLEDEAPNLL